MSMDYTATFAGPDAMLGDILDAVEKRLVPIGFTRSTSIVRVALDPARGVFDELDGEEIGGFSQVVEVKSDLAGWAGGAVEYLNRDFGGFYLLAGRSEGAFANLWVDVDEKRIRRFAEDQQRHTYYAVLNAVALGCSAEVGIANLEGAFEPIAPSELLSSVRAAQDRAMRLPAQLFVVAGDGTTQRDVEAHWGVGAAAKRFAGGRVIVETAEYRRFWGISEGEHQKPERREEPQN